MQTHQTLKPIAPAAQAMIRSAKGKQPALRLVSGHEEYEIRHVGDACKVLQRELALRVQRRTREEYRGKGKQAFTFKSLAAKSGLCNTTLYKIADGRTKWPALRTCILIFHAMGFSLIVRR